MLLHTSFILLLHLSIISLTSCEGGSSLTFVIDDSGSMEDDIDQVRRGASGIMDIVLKHKSSQIKDIVLVTFNDPIRLTLLRNKTRDRYELQTALNAIIAHNEDNYDWPELSMSGIELALQESQPGSYLYVFTDASAKDYRNVDIVKNLCQKTQSQIIFVLTDYCNTKTEIECIVYHEVAEACSGQVFIVDKNEISKVLEYVKETVKGDKNIITTRKVPPYKKTAIQFTVDDKTEYALISVSGEKAVISDKKGPSSNYETILSTSNVKVLKLSNPVPGSYELQVYGESQVSVIIFGRTDFVFDHGFSEMTPKSLQDTSKQPISGTNNHLSISVIDPDHEVNINSAQILNMNEEVIYELPLRKTANDFYITNQFVAPNSMFKVAVKGRVIKTGKDIRRVSKTPVEPQKPKIKPIEQKSPVSLISEGLKMNTEYDSTFQLTCKVTGYPAPTIIWKNDKGQVLPSKSYPVELPYKYISYLSLSHVKKSGKYHCYGSNALDNTHSSIDVTVLPAFKVDRNSKAPVNVNYDMDAVVHCKIQSSLPRRIIWFRTLNNKPVEQITSSGIYTISSDGTELKIKNMKINLQGKYTCKASLVADENVNAIFDTEVKISDLAKPEIKQTQSALTILEKTRVYIPCIITNGIPKPKITWMFQSKASGSLQSISNTGEQQEIISSKLSDAGYYTCTAENELGKVQKNTELIVEAPPTIVTGDKKEVYVAVEGDRVLKIPCKTVGYPKPVITWKAFGHHINTDNKYTVQEDGTLVIQNPVERDTSDTYICEVKNKLNTASEKFHVNVKSKPKIDQAQPTITIMEKTHAYIRCKVMNGNPKPKITWTFQSKASGIVQSIPSTGEQIEIASSKLSDAGHYTCTAENELGKVQKHTELIVEAPPTIITDDKKEVYVAIEGDRVLKIPCKTVGYPKPVITWKAFGHHINTGIKYAVQEDGTLVIQNPVEGDTGSTYICEAKNKLNTASEKFYVNVKSKPKIDQAQPTITIMEKTHAYIRCKVMNGNPKPKITWTFQSKASGILQSIPSTGEQIEIASSKLSDAGHYTCTAENELGKVQKHTELIVEAPPTIITDDKKEVYVAIEGDRVLKIPCKTVGYPKPVITWKAFGHHINTGIKYAVQEDGTLVIQNPVEGDTRSTYICEAKNKLSTASETFLVNVKSKPKIDQSKPTITIMEKTPVYIPCKIINGNPKPTITWMFQSKASGILQSIPNTGEHIEILNSKLSDAGHYTCTAENKFGKVQKHTELIVEAPPTIIVDDKKEVYVAVEGDRVLKIPCKTVGYPKPVITWKAFGHPISTGIKYAVEEDGTLAIQNPVERDTNDTYICEATNKLSTANEKFHVIVTSYLIHDDHFGNCSKIYLLGGETKQVKCVLPHEKTDSVRWYKNGLETNITGSFLDFISATQEYDGNYTCRVSNNLGSDSHTFEVDVGYAPRFKLNSVPTEIDWKGNRRDIVNCDAISKPVPTIKWTYNGKNVEGASKTQLKIFNWGDYTCEISNPHGVIKRKFKITSKDCLIDRSTNAAPNMPLILTNSSTWHDLETQNEFLILKSGASLKLSCNNHASKPNSFASLSSKKEITATCDHNNNLLVDGKVYKLSGLGCKSEVMPKVVRTSTKCLSDNTELIKVGFNADGFVSVYEVCYDTIQHLPLYTRAEMSDKNNFASVSEYKWYNYPGIGESKSDKRYTCQKGSKSCCFSKSQLIGAQDVHYGPPQTSTFIDQLNAIPVWQPCDQNRITWENLEDIVRDKYEEESEFSVWSGTSKPVTVNGATIPRYLWKVVISDQSEAMAMVYVNDPAPMPSDILCENVCDNDIDPWDKKSDRFTYCCGLEDFVNVFNYTIDIFNEL